MASYDVRIKQGAAKELERVPLQDRRGLVARIRDLAVEPRPAGAEKLSGLPLYRLRLGSYRVVYEIADRDRVVTVFRIAHRREAYR